jgi:hypothetical protein
MSTTNGGKSMADMGNQRGGCLDVNALKHIDKNLSTPVVTLRSEVE